jgi:Rps23 Pro-64 3,4-dihydroxylase Tpa1-like proline 4-hydroxylase
MGKQEKEKKSKPRVHKDLQGLEISVNQFGEIKSNMDIEKINAFLNKNVDDKKLAERDDYDDMKKGKIKAKKKKK